MLSLQAFLSFSCAISCISHRVMWGLIEGFLSIAFFNQFIKQTESITYMHSSPNIATSSILWLNTIILSYWPLILCFRYLWRRLVAWMTLTNVEIGGIWRTIAQLLVGLLLFGAGYAILFMGTCTLLLIGLVIEHRRVISICSTFLRRWWIK